MSIRKAPAKRFAFLLGNADYTRVSELINPLNDIENVAHALQSIGYDVTSHSNLDWNNTRFHFGNFAEKAGRCDAMVLYYCGHGVQINGENYIVPTDFDPETPVDADARTHELAGLVCVQDIMRSMSQAEHRVIFLDACRNDGGLRRIRVHPQAATPARSASAVAGTRALSPRGGPGLARQALDHKDQRKTFICFAADPGDVALDGPERGMSPFSEAVASHISLRGLPIFDLSQRIARDVRQKTGGRQVPWANSNLPDNFFFHEPDSWPIWIMIGLGALAGLLTAVTSVALFTGPWPIAFTDDITLYNVRDRPEFLLTSFFFGAVLGFGAYQWGRRAWYVPLLTCLLYVLAVTLIRLWYAPFAARIETQNLLASMRFDQLIGTGTECAPREVLYTMLLATTAMGAASVLSAAAWVRDMARLPRVAMGALIGASAALFLLLFLLVRDFVNDAASSRAAAAAAEHAAAVITDNSHLYWLESLGVLALFIAWHAALALNVGRAYARPTYD